MQTPAVVFESVGRVSARSIEMPPPGPGQVQIRTRYSTISPGTEGWCLLNQFTWQPTIYPSVPGYQRTGEIIALGEGVEGWKVGDICMATVGSWEGEVVPFWGAHAGVINTVSSELFRIPEGVDEVDASGCIVAQVGYNAASRVVLRDCERSLEPSRHCERSLEREAISCATEGIASSQTTRNDEADWVVVFGDGIIGQSAAQAARARGARVIVAGHRQKRLDLAVAMGAEAAFDSAEDGFLDRVREITGEHVTAVIDTIQTEAAQDQYMPLLEYAKGQVVYSGFTPGKVWADMGALQRKELTAHFVAGWTRPRMESTLALMAEKKMRVRPLVTHLVPWSEGPAMFEMILRKEKTFMAITLDWTGV